MIEFNRLVLVGGEKVPIGLMSLRHQLAAGAKGDAAAAKANVMMFERVAKAFDLLNKKSVDSLNEAEEYLVEHAPEGLGDLDRYLNPKRKKSRRL